MNKLNGFSSDLKSKVLVSVGIPTFNNPEGLRRTLNQVLSQTHSNLEIIISDNLSTDIEVEIICKEYSSQDSRIHYFRQSKNLGAIENFKFVLRSSHGEYFMWAADDDEWKSNFIEICLNASEDGESVGCQFDTFFRFSGQRNLNTIPFLEPKIGYFENIKRFFDCMQPSLIYGLHRRSTLAFYEKLPSFDFSDCFFVLHQILGPSFRTIPDLLYTAGVDAEEYEIKYSDVIAKDRLNYAPFFIRTCSLLLHTKKLSAEQKIRILKIYSKLMRGIISHHEKCNYPTHILLKQIVSLAMQFLFHRHRLKNSAGCN
jgi:glycosyltransferase involved in cell wall biosynthesis